jgi:hypothetical protein
MTHRIRRSLGLLFVVAAFMGAAPSAYAQLVCTGSNPGLGDQVWGTTFGPTELANACGVTAVGYFSLVNDTGSLNTAVGLNALFANTSGADNSAFGANALYSNTTGANNLAAGYDALYSNTTGKGNIALGTNALNTNTIGIRNLGIGSNALFATTTGGYNIAIGFDAGYNVTTGSNNIEIGTQGTASDNNTIQLGVQGTQTLTTIAGIYGTSITGSAVYVTSTGQLGVLSSSERYKTDIVEMSERSAKLQQLRPVTFHYRTDRKGVVQYGLIAEEVDKVYPELVIRDEAGKIQGVRYEELAPMLLNEFQNQQRKIAAVEASNVQQASTIAAQTAEIQELKRQQGQMLAALRDVQARQKLVARR